MCSIDRMLSSKNIVRRTCIWIKREAMHKASFVRPGWACAGSTQKAPSVPYPLASFS